VASPYKIPLRVICDNELAPFRRAVIPGDGCICLRWARVLIWPVSAYAGPESLDIAHICLCWAKVPGYGPYLLTLGQSLWRRPVSAYAGPNPGDGLYLGTTVAESSSGSLAGRFLADLQATPPRRIASRETESIPCSPDPS